MENQRGQGRESKYRQEFDKQVFRLCLLGATDKEIAAFFEVNEDTIYEWKKVHQSFSDSIKGGKINADAKVCESLYMRAIGFEYQETSYEKIVASTEDTEDIINEAYKKKVVVKYALPDVASQNIFLKNRRSKGRVGNLDNQGQVWADKHEHEHSGEVKGSVFNVVVNGSKSPLLTDLGNPSVTGLSGEQTSIQPGIPDNS